MTDETPVNVAIRAGKGGIVPPLHRRFGQPNANPSGPGGRTAGATIADWYNTMAGYTQDKLTAIVEDPDATIAQKVAAQRWLDAAGAASQPLGNTVEICDRTDGESLKRSQNENINRTVKIVRLPANDSRN